MPIYEYECEACGQQHEVIQRMSDPPLRECPACGEPRLRKLISAAAFHLKGTGWYATDFKDSGKKPAAKDADKPAAGAGTDAKDSKGSKGSDSAAKQTKDKAAGDSG